MSSLLLPLSFALGILGLGMAAVNWLWPAPPKAPAPDPRWLTALKELGRRMDRNTWIMVGIAAAAGFFIALFTGLLVYLVARPAPSSSCAWPSAPAGDRPRSRSWRRWRCGRARSPA